MIIVSGNDFGGYRLPWAVHPVPLEEAMSEAGDGWKMSGDFSLKIVRFV